MLTIATPVAAIDLAPRAAPGSQAPGAGRVRVQWLDVAKGIGIVLVVIGHALGGIIDSPAGAHAIGLRTAFLSIYVFHMPLFFLLSGLLVQERLARNPTKFGIDLLLTIAFPYFLWSIVQFTVIYAAGSLVNRPVDTYWPIILALPWRTVSQFWFLWVLFVLHGAAWAMLPRIGATMFLVIALVARVALPVTGAAHLAVISAPFYAIGVALAAEGAGARLAGRSLFVRGALLPLAAAAAILWATLTIGRQPGFAALGSPEIAGLAWKLWVTPAALIAVAAIIGVATTITGRAAAILAHLGQATMAIFVLHILFIAGMRIALARIAHLHDPLVLLAAVCAAGLVGPMAVRALARHIGLPKMIGLS